eukprot:COSAG01_NODE_1418_length_10375_cov_38.842254_8_plen_100_part_00
MDEVGAGASVCWPLLPLPWLQHLDCSVRLRGMCAATLTVDTARGAQVKSMPRAYWEHYHKNAGKLALLGAWINLFLGVGRLPVFGTALCCFVFGGSRSS